LHLDLEAVVFEEGAHILGGGRLLRGEARYPDQLEGEVYGLLLDVL
jgi:hypothetical protein